MHYYNNNTNFKTNRHLYNENNNNNNNIPPVVETYVLHNNNNFNQNANNSAHFGTQPSVVNYGGQPVYQTRSIESLSDVSSSIRQLVQRSTSLGSSVNINDDFPLKFLVAHAGSFVMINVLIIIIQIGLSLIRAVFSSIGIGYWVRSVLFLLVPH